ncbi:MAG TPA: carboxyl transferase domain-containing protein [Solirubrobacteraceae bacterium]|jgi:acetyl-CoA carboxylase carboxyltransferase component|nr:carboxyl transferase domain-containing protein [Solirubrobacteraceae bacterium]
MPVPGEQEVTAPFAGVVVAVEHAPGALVQAGAVLVVLEAMKMEHEVLAESDGLVRRVEVAAGEAIEAGALLVVLGAEDRVVEDAREEEGACADVEFGRARKGGPFMGKGFGEAPDGAVRAQTEPDPAPVGSDPAAVGSAPASVGSDPAPGGSESEAGGAECGSDVADAGDDEVRADLAAVRARHALGLDAARPEAVRRRRARGRRTARENLAELVDEGSYVEYGPLLFAAQERRRPKQELIEKTPADGLIAGVCEIDGNPCVAMSYDYTVLAGTQGMRGHQKKDRLFELAERRRLPVVLFAEGGGGRPGDVDFPIVAGLDCRAFHLFGRLSGLVPLVGIASGYCFAGNAALLGCCDVVIATEDSSIGMGGPAMIEGGGLGVFEPGGVGPIDVQHANGVVDLRVADDRAAVAAAKRYLSYFHGPVQLTPDRLDHPALDHPAPDNLAPDRFAHGWSAPDQRLLREIVPEQRKRAYEVRKVLYGLCDEDSVLELRDGFGAGMVTALARIEGKPLGVVANDPSHLGGAIDADAADKAARFLQLCDAFGLPVLFLCDTPGFMVGPDAERTATVRHFARLFTTGANLEVPFGTIVLRKGYGLGAQAMAGGSFAAPLFCVGWPTSEFGGMGLEGAVRLGMRRELEAIEDAEERERVFQATVAAAYEHGEGLNMASHGEIDDVIDPADSRRWIATLFDPQPVDWRKRTGKRRPNLDAW